MIYSKTLGGFYDPAIHGIDPPEDGVEVSDEEFATLMAGLAQGEIVVADEEGRPTLADPPPWIFYSKTTGMFYNSRLQSTPMPDDAVSIDEDLYTDLFEGQAVGKVIVADQNGYPVLQDPAPPSAQEVLSANTQTRDRLLAAAALAIAPLQDAVDLEESTDADVALLKKWKQYRVAVNRIDLNAASPGWPSQPA